VEKLDDPQKQEAEISAFFGDYDKSLELYKHMGRVDLAIQLFMRLGHWDRVESLVKVRLAHFSFHDLIRFFVY
jgi:WD repeat-containing protein 35